MSIRDAFPELQGFQERDGAGRRAGPGWAGSGRAANTQIFPLNTKETAPLAARSLARNKLFKYL